MPGANGSTYLNHCTSSNTRKLTLSCDLILKCANLDVDPDIGSSSNKNRDIFVNEDYLDFEHGSVSWSKFTPSRIWYNDSPYMLYESLTASTPTPTLGYYSILGYSIEGLKRCEVSGLLDFIMDGYYDFIPATIMTLLHLWNCINFIFLMTINRLNNTICSTIANMLFWCIEHIFEPYYTIETCVLILCMLFTPSILCAYFLSQLIPKMKCCRPDKTPLPEPKNKSKTVSTRFETNQVTALLLLLPSLLLSPTITMALLLLLLVSSVLSLTMNTTPAAGIYLPPFIVDISDIQEPAVELTPTTVKLKPEFMQIKDSRTTDGYKDPPP